MLKPGFFNNFFVIPILNLLVLFYTIFNALKIPFAFGFAIIALTALVRVILQPFFHKQMETAKKMQEMRPQLEHLAKKHKDDKKTLQQEQLKLYQQAGINPASGCLYMIIQIPIFIALFNTFNLFLNAKDMTKVIAEINNVLYLPFLKIAGTIDPNFFGLNLAQAPQKFGVSVYLLVPIVTAVLQYYQAKVATPPAPVTKGETGEIKKETVKQEDFQKAMSTQMKYIFPLLIGWFAWTLPAGLSLYWNVFSIFSIIQYSKLKK